jgi:hypothetical protein
MGLTREQAQGTELIFHIPKGREHLTALGGHGGL